MRITTCPKCGSSNIYYESAGSFDKRGKWVCKDCDYVGVLVIEKELIK